MPTTTKSSLINALADSATLSRREASQVVNAIFDTMSNALMEGKRIEMRGFGTFTVRVYDAYKGRNPRTGEEVAVAPKRSVQFKVGKDLRDRVNTSDALVDGDDDSDDGDGDED